jgi:hemoglobin
MKDISNKEDIKCYVDHFYSSVQQDDLIGPIFNAKINKDEWPIHLDKMYRFWNSVLFGKAEYRGQPFSHHINLGLSKEHFERWISLFEISINTNFKGIKADEVLQRAGKMRLMFEHKLQYLKNNPNIRPIV